MRRVAGMLVAITLAVGAAPAFVTHADDDDDAAAAARAATEIADAREQANAAADALFDTESQIDRLELEQQEIVGQIADLQAQIAVLQAKVEGVAVDRFARAGTSSIPLLTGFEHAGELAQVDVLIDVVNDTSADNFDDFDALSAQLADKQAELEQKQAETIAAKADFEQRRQAAIAEVAHLKEVEADRLQDVAIRKALEAEEAERRRKEEDKRKAEAAAAARAAATPTVQNSSSRPNGSGTSTGGGSGSSAGSGSSTAAGSGAGASAPTTDSANGASGNDGDAGDSGPTSGASGGVGGGQTGNGGIGGRSAGIDTGADYGFDGWLCPVQGVVFFGDTFGAPRSGGRRHQGVDMIGERGLPLVAVVDGFVQQKTNELGGNVVWLTGADGNRYYYAHLDAWAASGAVSAGTVIGYLGQTGNAQYSVPHLHFEIHPGGGVAANPYPTVRAHC